MDAACFIIFFAAVSAFGERHFALPAGDVKHPLLRIGHRFFSVFFKLLHTAMADRFTFGLEVRRVDYIMKKQLGTHFAPPTGGRIVAAGGAWRPPVTRK
jgi:hypothetical protein